MNTTDAAGTMNATDNINITIVQTPTTNTKDTTNTKKHAAKTFFEEGKNQKKPKNQCLLPRLLSI